MALPRLRRLLDQLDAGHHAERMRTMALLGRDHAGDLELARLLDEVSSQSDYHHFLTLVSAAAASDDERLQAALTHGSPRIRLFALANVASLDLSPESVRHALLDGSAEDRRQLRRFVNRHGRTDLAEAVIDDVRHELGDREAAALLATCGEDTVRRLLPEVLYAVASLAPLARRHPGALLDHIEDQLRPLPQRQRDQFWSQVDASLADLSLADPDRVLRLIEELGPSEVVPRGVQPSLGRLIRYAPSRVAALLAQDDYIRSIGWWLPAALRRHARWFSVAHRVAIAKALRERESLFFAFIGRFPPSERAEVFRQALAGLETSNKIWPPALLEVLPREVRHPEARRILGLRSIRQSDALRLEYTAMLAFEDARAALEPELRRAKAEDRAIGYRLLITSARLERTPEALSEALRLTRRLRNEQDPVRLAAVEALARVSPVQVGDEHLDDLQALVAVVVDARDSSPATIQMLVNLAFRVLGASAQLPHSPLFRFVLQALDDLAGPSGAISFHHLDPVLHAGAETALIDALLARLERDAAHGRYHLALSLAQALGKRGWSHEGLQALVGRATAAASDAIVRRAIYVWLADPRARRERVARLLAGDESTVALPVVLGALNRSRQDLLDIVLRSRPLRGRFLNGDVRYVPVITEGFERWLPRQCEAYQSALQALIAASATAVWSRAGAVRALARLPQIGADALRPHIGSDDVAVMEAALSGLAWTDRPGDAFDELLAHAGSDRARVAVYAATRCARFVPRRQLGPSLVRAIEGEGVKVTAQKEAVRLLGAHRPPGSGDLLIGLGSQDDLHRDVRIAVGRALRGLLDDDRVWELCDRLASGPDEEARSLLDTAPTQIAPRHRPRFAALVVSMARSASPQVRSEAFTALGAWAPWSAVAPEVAALAIEDLEGGREWHEALAALGSMLHDGVGWEHLDNLVTVLAGRGDAPEHNAGAERDQPSGQRLGAVMNRVASLPARERDHHRARLLDIADILGTVRPLSPEELIVRLAALDLTQPVDALAALARRLDEHPLLAHLAVTGFARTLDRDQASWTDDDLAPSTDDLVGRGSIGAGALAVQLVHAVGVRYGWPQEWRDRLRALRAHSNSDVATLARAVATAPE